VIIIIYSKLIIKIIKENKKVIHIIYIYINKYIYKKKKKKKIKKKKGNKNYKQLINKYFNFRLTNKKE